MVAKVQVLVLHPLNLKNVILVVTRLSSWEGRQPMVYFIYLEGGYQWWKVLKLQKNMGDSPILSGAAPADCFLNSQYFTQEIGIDLNHPPKTTAKKKNFVSKPAFCFHLSSSQHAFDKLIWKIMESYKKLQQLEESRMNPPSRHQGTFDLAMLDYKNINSILKTRQS